MRSNQNGAIPLVMLLVIIGVIAFVAVTAIAPFRDSLLSGIYPKSLSKAAEVVTNPNLAAPTNLTLLGLDSTIRANWTASTDPNTVGHVFSVWDGDTFISSKVLSKTAKVADANGLVSNHAYTIKVQALDANGKLSPALVSTGSTDMQYPMKDAAFFENFNDAPHGMLDFNYFDQRTHHGQGPDFASPLDTGMIAVAERHFHTQVIGDNGVGDVTLRPRVPFDFTGRTGTLQFEVDLATIQTAPGKWFEVHLNQFPASDTIFFGESNGEQYPNDMEFTFRKPTGSTATDQLNLATINVNIGGTLKTFIAPVSNKVITSPNVRVPIVIKVSQNSAEMFVNGQSAVKAEGYTLPFSKGFWTFIHRTMYPDRGRDVTFKMYLQLLHWETIQYDGPPGSFNPVVRTYYQPNCDKLIQLQSNCPNIANNSTFTIDATDNVTNAKSAYLIFNASDDVPVNVNINGTSVTANLNAIDLQNAYLPTLFYAEVPVSALRNGANSIRIPANGTRGVQLVVIQNQSRQIANPPMHPMDMIAVTNGNFSFGRDGDKKPMTTYLYSSGSGPVNYNVEVVTTGQDARWLAINTPKTGTAIPLPQGGALVPVTFTPDYALIPNQNDSDPDQSLSTAIIKITGGVMPAYIAVHALDKSTILADSAYPINPSIPVTTTTFNKAAIPDYYGANGSPIPTSSPTPAPSQTTVPSPVASPSVSSTPIPARTVVINNSTFTPSNLTVKVGETVTWVNNDVVNHTVTSATNLWAARTLSPGQSFTYTFTQAGNFAYSCTIHPSMMGSITVNALATSSPVASGGSKPGDIDGNGRVDVFDYNTVLTNFGKTGTNIAGDLDKNGKVDIFDFNVVLSNFGK